MQVRRANEKDISAIMGLLKQVNNVHNAGRADLFIKDKTKYTEDELAEILKDDRSPVFVCEDETGAILGHGFCVYEHASGNNIVERDTLYIDDICVSENARRQGVGEALYRHIKAFAKDEGFYNLTLNVWSLNKGAAKFYEKMGLKPYKVGMEEIL